MLLWQCASLVGTHHNTVIVIVPGQAALSAGTAGSDPQITQVVRLILVVYGQEASLARPRGPPLSALWGNLCVLIKLKLHSGGAPQVLKVKSGGLG